MLTGHDRCQSTMETNVGPVDANIRMFLAVPFLVLAVTSSIAYHAYTFAAVTFVLGTASFASGKLHFCPVYRALGIRTRFTL